MNRISAEQQLEHLKKNRTRVFSEEARHKAMEIARNPVEARKMLLDSGVYQEGKKGRLELTKNYRTK